MQSIDSEYAWSVQKRLFLDFMFIYCVVEQF